MTRLDEVGSHTTDDVLNHAAVLLERGEPRSALMTLRQIGAGESGYEVSIHLSAEAYRMLRMWDQVERVARDGIAREIAPARFLSMLAESLVFQSKTDEAVEACERALAAGGHGSLWVLMVDALCKDKRVDEAIARIEGIPSAKRDDSAWLAAGLAEVARKDWTRAEKAFRECVKQAPGHAKAHYSLGRVYTQLEQFDKAMKHMARAARLDPHDEEIQLQYIFLLIGTGDTSRFEKQMDLIGARDPRLAGKIAFELRKMMLDHTHEAHPQTEVPESGNEEPGEIG